MRYLAIDYGSKRTGLAVCDPGETIASPLAVLDSRKNLLEKIARYVKSEKIEAVLVGLPFNMDGSEGPQAKQSLALAERLKKVIDVPVSLCDERLSSFAAEEKLAAADFTRKRLKKRLDAVAAAQFLQSFLDSKSQNR